MSCSPQALLNSMRPPWHATEYYHWTLLRVTSAPKTVRSLWDHKITAKEMRKKSSLLAGRSQWGGGWSSMPGSWFKKLISVSGSSGGYWRHLEFDIVLCEFARRCGRRRVDLCARIGGSCTPYVVIARRRQSRHIIRAEKGPREHRVNPAWLPCAGSEGFAGCTDVAFCLWSWWPSFEGCPGACLEDVRDELPTEGYVAHVDGGCDFGHVPVGVD